MSCAWRASLSFPVVRSFAGTNSAGNVTTTTPNVTGLSPAPQTGDLIIIAIAKDGTGGFSWPGAGWTALTQGTFETTNQQGVFHIRAKVWDADSDTNPAITHANEGTAHHIYCIQKGTWHGVIAGVEPQGVGVTTGDSTNPNPPSLDPTGWGLEDTLWLAFAANDGNVAITAGPTGYTNFQNDRWANSNGVGVASAREDNTQLSSENPGVFTMNTEQWAAATIAIRPCQQVVGAHISSTLALTAPTLSYAVSGAHIASGLQMFAPTVEHAAGGTQEVTGAHISSTLQLFAPTAQHVILGAHISSGSALFEPTLRYVVDAAHTASTLQLFAPSAQQNVVGATIASGHALFAPSAAYRIAAAFIASTLVLSPPSVSPGPVTAAAAHIASTAVLSPPSLQYAVAAPHVSSGAQLFAPTLGYAATAAHISSTLSLFPPQLAYSVVGATIAAGSALFSPTLAYQISVPCIGEIHNNLHSMWRLEEASGVRVDSVGGHTLSDNNTVTQATGKVGDAAHFTRADLEYLQIASPSTAMQLAGDMAFSVWVYVDSLPGASVVHAIVDRQRNYDIDLINSGQAFRFYYLDSIGITRQVIASIFGTPPLATWIHIYADYDAATKTSRICINNGVTQSATHPNPPDYAVTGAFRIGDRANVRHWDGRIDAFHIWQRRLTVAERDYVYNSGNGREVYTGTSASATGTTDLFPPSLAYVVAAPHIPSTAELFSPSISFGGQVVEGAHISSAATLFAPSLAHRVDAAHISSATTLFAPALQYALSGAFIASSSQLFAPSSAYQIAGAFVPSTAALFSPSLVYHVAAQHIASTAALFAPTVTLEGGVAGEHIASTLQMFAPTVSPGAVSISGAHIPSGAALFSPSLSYAISGAHITSSLALFAPQLAYALASATIPSGSALFPPSLHYVVVAAHQTSTLQLFAPSLQPVIAAQHLSSTLLLFSPSITQGAAEIFAVHIPSTLQIFAPSLFADWPYGFIVRFGQLEALVSGAPLVAGSAGTTLEAETAGSDGMEEVE